jgi:hypothetical protein
MQDYMIDREIQIRAAAGLPTADAFYSAAYMAKETAALNAHGNSQKAFTQATGVARRAVKAAIKAGKCQPWPVGSHLAGDNPWF